MKYILRELLEEKVDPLDGLDTFEWLKLLAKSHGPYSGKSTFGLRMAIQAAKEKMDIIWINS